jgi:putative Ca2+/H+ antiporter (TMEM165/GDT1 family)
LSAELSTRVLIDNPDSDQKAPEEKEVKEDGPLGMEVKDDGVAEGEESVKPVEKKKKKKSCFKCKNPILFFLALLMCSEWGDRS